VTTPSLCEISHISKDYRIGQTQSYALFNVAFSGGFLVGPVLGGFLVKTKGWDVLVTSLAAVMVTGIPPVLVWTGGPLKWSTQGFENQKEDIRAEPDLKE